MVGDDKLPVGERTGPNFVNDNGTRYLVGDGGEEYIWITGDIPENRC